MASFAKKHNSKGKIFDFTIPMGYEYKKLPEMVQMYGMDAIHKVNAIYISKGGNYGKQPVVATDHELVNLPSHLVGTVEEIFNDDDSIALVNAGMVGFFVYRYENNKGIQHSIQWFDLPPNTETATHQDPATPDMPF